MSPKYQDIIPPNNPERRSIRDIPLPERKKSSVLSTSGVDHPPAPKKKTSHASHALHSHTKQHDEDQNISIPIHPMDSSNEEHYHHDHEALSHSNESEIEPAFYQSDASFSGGSRKRPLVTWAIGILAILLVGYFVIGLFTHATITVGGKNEQVALNGASFTLASSNDSTGIMYDIITLSAESSTTANASEKITSTPSASSTSSSKTPETGTKATGKVIIYNNYSTSPQELIATTRLQTPDGLIYRLNTGVTVPGKTTKDGKTVPGSVTATITADQVGDKYNSGPKDFTVPGLKGTEKYTSFYARSNGALAGGSITTAAPTTVGASSNGTVEDRLREDLKNQLVNQITAQLPENFVYVSDSMIVSYTSPIITPGTDGQSTVAERATATAVIMDKASLIKHILVANAGGDVPSEEESKVTYDADLSSLSVAFPSGTTAATLKAGSSKISLNGSVTIKPVFTADKVARAVSTLSKVQAIEAIQGMDNVETVDISITPFWKKSLPRADKITVKQ